MATSVIPQGDFLIAVWSIQAMNYANVAVFALWTYDSLLRFQQEVTFLAHANKNVGKFLYIGARYMPLLIAIPGLICEPAARPSLPHGEPRLSDRRRSCNSLQHDSSILRRIYLRTPNLRYVGGETPSTLGYVRDHSRYSIYWADHIQLCPAAVCVCT